ncbi:MAG TPA: DPP IV N-terminal domain-containing protein [Steroidobacteraceae bacterium]|nr:DPP IV N-terminal domain-containing protein [Steroidobacteraceae bacterium]
MKKIWAGILCATAALAEGVVAAGALSESEPAQNAPAQGPSAQGAPAQYGPAVTTADYARAERFLPYNTTPLVLHSPGPATWLPDETAWYQIQTSQGPAAVLVDPAHRTREEGSPQAKQAASVAAAAAADPNVAPSPDGKLVAFIRGDNLWVRELATGKETQLTTDGANDFGYATDNTGWQHTHHPIVLWSPDSRRIATFQQDQRGVGETYLIRTQPGHPQLERWKYAMAGDPVIATLRRVIIDVTTRTVVPLQIPPDPHRSSPCYHVECGDGTLADAQWNPDSTQLAFVSTSRDHKDAKLRIADAATGAVREVLEEQAATYFESDISQSNFGAVNWRYLPARNELIWYSARDDWAHLYLYDLATGKLKHRITAGPWNVIQVLKVDEKARVVYFLGVGREPGQNPYFVHLYKVGLNGLNLRLLTPEDATHEVSLAPSGSYFIDSYSTPDTAPVTVLRNGAGKKLLELEKADITGLTAQGWVPPELITVKARDGVTDLHGLLFKPSHFDASRRYPLVNEIYPGPQVGSVNLWSDKQQWKFAPSRGDAQSLAELGFIVVAIDGMGTELRSRKFHDTYYGDMGDNTLPDQVAAMTELAHRYTWIDLERAGIYGHSGGGFAAAAAMLRYPDFFKVGIAESGNHDQTGYTDDWGEKFQGLLQRRPDGTSNYDSQANQNLAANLKGHLLLAHGTLDENVPPNLTLLLADALINANKNFDLILLPNQHHEYTGRAQTWMIRQRWDYFVRYLLGAYPPVYELHLPDSRSSDRSGASAAGTGPAAP